MNIWALLPLISSIISIFIALYIFYLDLKSSFNKIFFFIVILCFIWSFSEFNYRITRNVQIAFVWTQIAKVWIFTIPLTLHLILVFFEKKIKNKILFYILTYGVAIFLYIINILNLPIRNLTLNYWGYSYIEPNNIFFYILYFGWSVLISFFIVIFSLYYAINKKKTKDFLFVISVIIPFIVGLVTEFFLPILLKVKIPEMTTTSFILFFVIIAYIIKKYNIFMPDLKKSIDTILLTMSDALFILDTDFRIKIINWAGINLLGDKEDEILNKNILLFISKKSLTHFIKMLKFTILNDYIIKDEEAFFLSKQEKEIPVSFSCSLIKDKNKMNIGLLLIARDITGRKNLENMLELSNESFINIIEKNIEGIVVMDKDLTINYINPIAKRYLNIKESDNVGATSKFPYNVSNYEIEEIKINIGEGETGIGELITINTKWKKEDAFLVIIRDITTRKEMEKKIISSLREKENLLSEIHHRIKNNLQIVMSLLKLPLRFNDKEEILKNILLDAQFRIKTIALIHEMLYNKENFLEINFKNYIKELTQFLLLSFKKENKINVRINIEDLKFDSDICISCGLIITELFTNSIKYAFDDSDDKDKTIIIELYKKNNSFVLNYRDNGKGFKNNIDLNNINTTGLYLIKLLVLERLKGDLKINVENGVEYFITFQAEEYLF